jgi:hypothetical protein
MCGQRVARGYGVARIVIIVSMRAPSVQQQLDRVTRNMKGVVGTFKLVMATGNCLPTVGGGEGCGTVQWDTDTYLVSYIGVFA